MSALAPHLITGHADIDAHHREFVDALAALSHADDVTVALDRFVAHCEAHFSFENEQMEASGFPPIGCHRGEHDMVLETAREVRRRVAAGDERLAASLVPALTEWFDNHVMSMDAVLARYLEQGASAQPACGAVAA